ncbi:YfiH family protein [Eubacterium ruminantium]|nr:YfiH family protein [Eubacterium ruminantium]
MKEFSYLKKIKIDNDIEVPFISSKLLEKYSDRIAFGFSTRLGGVSTGHLESMNLSFHRNDDPACVYENHRRFAAAVGYDEKKTVFSDQVHKDHIRKCTEEDTGKGIIKENDITETDGLITNIKELPLMTFYADCVPLLFYAPDKNVIASVHSGWKGTAKKIGPKTAGIFRDDYGCDISKLICFIGPSICKDCYEISSDVAEQFYDMAEYDISAEKEIYNDSIDKYDLKNVHVDEYKSNKTCIDGSGKSYDDSDKTDSWSGKTDDGSNTTCDELYKTRDVTDDSSSITDNELIKYDPENIKDILTYSGNDKYHLSLQKAIRKTLIEAGMKEENIEISGICTACNDKLLFSHRKTNGLRGNLAAVIMLR